MKDGKGTDDGQNEWQGKWSEENKDWKKMKKIGRNEEKWGKNGKEGKNCKKEINEKEKNEIDRQIS